MKHIRDAEDEGEVADARSAKVLLENGRSLLICFGCDIRIETGSLKDCQGTIFTLALQSILRKVLSKFRTHEEFDYPPSDVRDDILRDVHSLKDLVNPIRMSQAISSGRGPFDDLREKINQVFHSKAIPDRPEGNSISQTAESHPRPSIQASIRKRSPLESFELDHDGLQESSNAPQEFPLSRYVAKYNGYPVLVEPAEELSLASRRRSANGELPRRSSTVASTQRMRDLLASHIPDIRWLYYNTGTILDLLGWMEKPLGDGNAMCYWIFRLYPDRFQSNDVWSLTQIFQNTLDIILEARLEIAYSIAETVHLMHLANCHQFDLRSENIVFIPLENGKFYSLGPPVPIRLNIDQFGGSETAERHAT